MVTQMFQNKLPTLLAVTLTLVFLSLPDAYCQDMGPYDAGYHNRLGMEYFKKGFYDHTPKHQDAEADKNYGFAVKEFSAAISKDSSSTEAHRNLARVYYVQKNFAGAVEEYKRVTELAPGDLDAYVNCALAYIELNMFDEAIQQLKIAKNQAYDPKVLETLDAYIAKAIAHQAKGVR